MDHRRDYALVGATKESSEHKRRLVARSEEYRHGDSRSIKIPDRVCGSMIRTRRWIVVGFPTTIHRSNRWQVWLGASVASGVSRKKAVLLPYPTVDRNFLTFALAASRYSSSQRLDTYAAFLKTFYEHAAESFIRSCHLVFSLSAVTQTCFRNLYLDWF